MIAGPLTVMMMNNLKLFVNQFSCTAATTDQVQGGPGVWPYQDQMVTSMENVLTWQVREPFGERRVVPGDRGGGEKVVVEGVFLRLRHLGRHPDLKSGIF